VAACEIAAALQRPLAEVADLLMPAELNDREREVLAERLGLTRKRVRQIPQEAQLKLMRRLGVPRRGRRAPR
jgi:DNA-directed RNA polymerase sigma subunit (sigma70/sigma32)